MKKIVFSLLVFSSIAFGQIEKQVGDFSKVTSFDQIGVFLIKSNENKVIIDGKNSNDVQVINNNGELKIRMPLTKLLQSDSLYVLVYFKDIKAIEANEGSIISSEFQIKLSSLEIIAKEGAKIKLEIDVEKLTSKVTQGAMVTLNGNATNQDVLINTGGVYEAKGLETTHTQVTINAGGAADVYVRKSVLAKVRAGGDILIYGKPNKINKKVTINGSIKEAN